MSHNSLINLHKPHKASLSPKNWDNQLYISATSQMGLWIHRREWKKGMSSLKVDAHINTHIHIHTYTNRLLRQCLIVIRRSWSSAYRKILYEEWRICCLYKTLWTVQEQTFVNWWGDTSIDMKNLLLSLCNLVFVSRWVTEVVAFPSGE